MIFQQRSGPLSPSPSRSVHDKSYEYSVLNTPGKHQPKTLLTIKKLGIKIARNSAFDCHLSPVRRQMAIENSVSNNYLSTFVDSINVFDCHKFGVNTVIKISYCQSAILSGPAQKLT